MAQTFKGSSGEFWAIDFFLTQQHQVGDKSFL